MPSLCVICRAPEDIARAQGAPLAAFGQPVSSEDAQVGPLGLDLERCRAFESGVADALAGQGYRVVIAPHVYHMTPDHPARRRLAECQDDLAVGCWLAARPAFWTLRALGVPGESEASGQGRTMQCFDLKGFDSVQECAAALAAAAGDAGTGGGGVEDLSDGETMRWYPVLDYDRCVSCKQCHEFCMFGVYSVEDGQVIATDPDQCKPGCPACARVCPKGAVMFPHYLKDPAIAGVSEAVPVGQSPDVDAFFAGGRASPSSPTEGRKIKESDDLDQLIDELEELDR